jgi:hypothetical protein
VVCGFEVCGKHGLLSALSSRLVVFFLVPDSDSLLFGSPVSLNSLPAVVEKCHVAEVVMAQQVSSTGPDPAAWKASKFAFTESRFSPLPTPLAR